MRHPNVETHIKLDFIIMKYVAYILENLLGMSWLNLSESLSQFSHTIAAQVHLDTEGLHLIKLNSNFKKWFSAVSFPKPIIITSSLLVETWEWGVLAGTFVDDYTNTINTCISNKNKGKNNNSVGSKVHGENTLVTKEEDNTCDYTSCVTSDDLITAHFLVTKGEDLYLKMLFQDNLMHADLHPGIYSI